MSNGASNSVLSVRSKILLSILLINLTFIAGGAVTLSRFRQTVFLHRQMMDEYSFSVHHAHRLLDALLEMDDVYVRGRQHGKPYDSALIDSNLARLQEEIRILRATDLDSIEIEKLDRIDKHLLQYASLLKTNPRLPPSDIKGWQELLLETDALLNSIKQDIGGFLDINRSQLEANDKLLQMFFETSFHIGIVVLIFSLMLTALLSWLMISAVIAPIKRLVAWVEEFRRAPEKPTEPLMPVRADEIGYLTQSFGALIEAIVGEKEELKRQTITDELTGLYNFRYFQIYLQKEISNLERHGRRMALAILDIDHFKHFNDTHGHQLGNALLKEVAGLIKSQIRAGDFLARYGGEEFVLVFSETPRAEAVQLCERIRSAVEQNEFPGGKSQPGGSLTVSIGVAFFPESAKFPKALVEKADQALYQAKGQGRNRVVQA